MIGKIRNFGRVAAIKRKYKEIMKPKIWDNRIHSVGLTSDTPEDSEFEDRSMKIIHSEAQKDLSLSNPETTSGDQSCMWWVQRKRMGRK